MSHPPREPIPYACRRLLDLAERNPRRAVALARRAVAQSAGAAQAWACYTLAWSLFCWERFDEARAQLGVTETLHTGRPELTLRCRCVGLLIDFSQKLGAPIAADLIQVAADLERSGEQYLAQLTRLYLAALMNILGNTPEATELLAQLAAKGDALDRRICGRTLRVQGATAKARGDYSRAARLLDQADEVFAQARLRVDRAKGWYERAAVALDQEQLDKALGLYLRAERVFANRDLPLRMAMCTRDASAVYTRLGAYDRGLELALRALVAFDALGRTLDVARCHLLLGNLYYFSACWEAALGAYRRAEAGLAALGVTGGDTLIARRNQALVLQAMGQNEQATALVAALKRQARRLDAAAELAEIVHTQGLLLADRASPQAAAARFAEASRLFRRLDNRPAAAVSTTERAWLLFAQGEHAAAATLFKAAAAELAAQPFYRWRAEHGLARCAEASGDALSALAAYRQACAMVAGLRARLWNETLSSRLYQHSVGRASFGRPRSRIHAESWLRRAVLRPAGASGVYNLRRSRRWEELWRSIEGLASSSGRAARNLA